MGEIRLTSSQQLVLYSGELNSANSYVNNPVSIPVKSSDEIPFIEGTLTAALWETVKRKTQVRHVLIPDPRKCEIINMYHFQSLNLEIIRYTTLDTGSMDKLCNLPLPQFLIFK